MVVVDGRTPLTIEDIVAVANGDAGVRLSDAEEFRTRITRGADFVDRLIAEDGVVYGVSTGYGDSCTVAIPPALVPELPHHLYAYHGVGLGRFLDAGETRAVLLARLVSLAQGASGIRPTVEGAQASRAGRAAWRRGSRWNVSRRRSWCRSARCGCPPSWG